VSSQTIMQKPLTPRCPVTVEHVRDHQGKYGLKSVGPRSTDDLMVRRVSFIIEDWNYCFDVRRVAWSTVITALASEAETRDLEMLDGTRYMKPEDYRTAAEWRLMYVLNHLTGSGLKVVRMPSDGY